MLLAFLHVDVSMRLCLCYNKTPANPHVQPLPHPISPTLPPPRPTHPYVHVHVWVCGLGTGDGSSNKSAWQEHHQNSIISWFETLQPLQKLVPSDMSAQQLRKRYLLMHGFKFSKTYWSLVSGLLLMCRRSKMNCADHVEYDPLLTMLICVCARAHCCVFISMLMYDLCLYVHAYISACIW